MNFTKAKLNGKGHVVIEKLGKKISFINTYFIGENDFLKNFRHFSETKIFPDEAFFPTKGFTEETIFCKEHEIRVKKAFYILDLGFLALSFPS